MADAERRDKIAAAKKKLKQFQKAGKTPNNSPSVPPEKKAKQHQKDKNGPKKVEKHEPDKENTAPSPMQHSLQNEAPSLSPHAHHESHDRASPSPLNHHLPESVISANAVSPSNGPSPPSPDRLTASTEQLQQLSRQMNGLINESPSHSTNHNSNSSALHSESSAQTALEARNQELASLLDQQTQTNQHLEAQLQDLKKQTVKLQKSLEEEKKGFEERLKRELGALKEQLQVHIQTIGILVAEKTELQSSLNQSQKLADQRLEDIEELSGRLKASRQRVADLERTVTSTSGSSQRHEQSSKEYSKEVDRLKMELYKLTKSNEEFQQKNSELQGKLQKKVTAHAKAEDELIELRGKLEMTELYVQQLQNGSEKADSANSVQIEQLLQEKGEMSSKIDQYEESFKKLSSERDQINKQYQEYIDQLQKQSQHLQVQINSLVGEKEQLLEQYATLQEVTQQMKSKQDSAEELASASQAEREALKEQVMQLQSSLDAIQKTHQNQVADNSQLSRMIIEKEERIMELEMSVQRMGDSQVDQEKLLETIQSDKTALSRALAQNKELKAQLAELQNGFVKMSNDNMELLSQLQGEQHISGELGTRLTQQEAELKEIRTQLTSKEKKLEEMEKMADDPKVPPSPKEMTAEEVDRKLREFKEQSPLLETLQRELSSAQDTINALTNQNSELRSQIVHSAASSNDSRETDLSKTQMENMSASVRQLEMERNEVIEQLKAEQRDRKHAQDTLLQLEQELAMNTPATLNGDVINKAQFEALQHAMQQLEGKFSSAMRDKAELMDKTERLEHIIMQLQGETDTIGEYVALYQQQRSILKARTVEKDDYISRLAREREEMSDKVGQLQALVMQLLGERQMLHNYHDDHDGSPAGLQPNHVMPSSADKHFGSKLDSSNLEDWPDYTSSGEDSDASEVEHIVAGDTSSPSGNHLTHKHPSSSRKPRPETPPEPKWNIPEEDHTAQRIMSLLTEMGSCNIVDRTLDDTHFLHCIHCTGRILHI